MSDDVAPSPAPFDPERVIHTLVAHRVEFVLIGALAARMYGFPRVTADLDLTPARDMPNVERLAVALRALNARVYTDSVPEGLAFDCSAAMLARHALWNFVTDAGRIDIAFEPAGTTGFEDLMQNAVPMTLDAVQFSVASLDDLIRSKTAAGRPKDRADVLLLRAIRAQSRR